MAELSSRPQVTMKKGCALPHAGLNTSAHKVGVRRAYYAMIAEFDDMVGEYMDAVDDAALTARAHTTRTRRLQPAAHPPPPPPQARTVIVVSSDHGDMQMEHQQFYKMSAYEASTRVPLVR